MLAEHRVEAPSRGDAHGRGVDHVGGGAISGLEKLARDGLRRVAVGQAADHDVCPPRHVGDSGQVRDGVGATIGTRGVVRDDLVARADQVGGECAAHVAETDETDGGADRRHRQPWSLDDRSSRITRRADTPAGPPA